MKRASFLETSSLGVVAAVMGAPSPSVASEASAAVAPPGDRKTIAFERRLRAATEDRDQFAPSVSNGDEARYADVGYIGSFTKGLPHDARGRVDDAAFRAFRRAIDARDPSLLDPRTSATLRRVLERTLSDDTCIAGCDPFGIAIAAPAPLASARIAHDAIELAWWALARDVPFAAYDGDATIAAASRDLGRTPQTLFRPTGAAAKGPMISQLVLLPIPYGAYGSFDQRYAFFAPGRDYVTSLERYRATRDGVETGDRAAFESTKRYVATGRDLATWVAFPIEPFRNAAQIIGALPGDARARAWSFDNAFAAMGLAANAMGIATFHQKFGIHLRLRPEAYLALSDAHTTDVTLDRAFAASPAVERLRARFGNALLPQTYVGGAPSHPSYPAAHASFAGAMATVLKALTREAYVFERPVVAVDGGSSLAAYNGDALTLGGEIDKLAGNYAFGRHAAGVHYREDSEAGLRYGETIALGVLRDLARMSGSSSPGYELTTFDGRRVELRPN